MENPNLNGNLNGENSPSVWKPIIYGILVVIVVVAIVISVRYATKKITEGTPPSGAVAARTGSTAARTVSAAALAGAKIAVSTDDKGVTTISEPLEDGSTKITVKDPVNNTVTESTILPDGTATPPFSVSSLLANMVKDPFFWEALGTGLAMAAVLEVIKKVDVPKVKGERQLLKAASKMMEQFAQDAENRLAQLGVKIFESISKAGKQLSLEALELAAKRAAQKGAERLVERAAARAAAKAAAKLATTTAVAAATGPLAPFVEAAEFAFNMFTGVLDQMDLGGFTGQTTLSILNMERDAYLESFKYAWEDYNIDLPVYYGPNDAMDGDIHEQLLESKITELAKIRIAEILEEMKVTIPKPQLKTEEEFVAYVKSKIDFEKIGIQADGEICVSAGGVMVEHPKDKKQYCTWDNPEACLAPYPLKEVDDTYYEFDKESKTCQLKPGSMRQKCDAIGLGVTYNMETGSCKLSDEYCFRYGNDKGANAEGDCEMSRIEEIFETILGRSFTRGIVNVFSLDMYEDCKPGYEPGLPGTTFPLPPAAGLAIAILVPGGPMIAAGLAASKFFCTSYDACPEGEENVNGICYDPCPDGYDRKAGAAGDKVNGMCYKCDPGYHKSATGMCHKDSCEDPLERGWASQGLCYPKCREGYTSDGVTLCLGECPDGYRTEPLTCMRDVSDYSPYGTSRKCPDGWETTIEGPGGMCRQKVCDDGYYLAAGNTGVCYEDCASRDSGDNNETYNFSLAECNTCRATCHKYSNFIGCKTENGNLLHTWTSKGKIKTEPCDLKSSRRSYILPSKSILDVGVCSPGLTEKGGMCYESCREGYTLTDFGTCHRDADSKPRPSYSRGAGVPAVDDQIAYSQGPQRPRGPALDTYARKRIVPFADTSKETLRNSNFGKCAGRISKGAAEGSAKSTTVGLACMSMQANPIVLGLGVGDLVEVGMMKAEGA